MFFSALPIACVATKSGVRTKVPRNGIIWLLGAAVGTALACEGQTPAPVQTTTESSSIRGVVLNANTNQPIGRALVQSDQQAILTTHDGKFVFAGLRGTAWIKVSKPGFYQGLDPQQTAMLMVPVGSPNEVEIRLYPEALLTGTLLAPNGDPLPQIHIQALGRVDDESGERWNMGGQTTTNSDGEFRLPLPPGDYVAITQFSPSRAGGEAHQAVLPALYPSGGSSGTSAGATSSIHLPSGSEQHIELRPQVRPSHSVHIQVDSGGAPPMNSPQIQARLANGLDFSPMTRRTDKQGELQVTLPSGSYVLSATANGQDEVSYGETKVTVAEEDVSGVAIHLQAATQLKIEVSVDPAATSTTATPSDNSLARQLGVFLQKTNGGIRMGNDAVSPSSRSGQPFSFYLLPGTYRLRSSAYNSWYIESATAGGSDLLTQELVIDGGSSSLPLRLVVGNTTATVKGTVKLAGNPSAGYVYLLSESPSASPILFTRAGQDGIFSRALLPPGSYRALASENRSFFDLTDPEVQRHFASYMKTVTVAAGGVESVDLNAVPAADWKP